MNWSSIALAFLVGWLFGVWMAYRKILADRKTRINQFGKAIWKVVEDAEIINITVTEEGEKEVKVDQEKLDQLLGNKTKH